MKGELERFSVACVRYSDDAIWSAEVTFIEADDDKTGRRFSLLMPFECAEDIRLGDEFALVAIGRKKDDG